MIVGVNKMTVTVQQILELPILKEAKIISGLNRLNEQRVEWMTATEVPVKDSVRKDEIILTTGVESSSTEKLLHFVKNVQEAHAAALAIATGKFIKEIPQEVIQYANENDFIIIELPWNVRFTDIQRETTKEINKQENKQIEKAQQIQDRLIDYVLQDKELTDILHYVENELNCSIVFTDHYGRVESASIHQPEEIIDLWEKLEQDVQVIEENTTSYQIEKIPYNEGYLVKKEVASNIDQMGDGYFIIIFENEEALNESSLQMIESLAAATAVWLSREDAIVKTELRLKNQFIWDLAKSKDVVFEEKSQTRANLFGFQLDLPYVCIVGYSKQLDINKMEEFEEHAIGQKPIIYDIEKEIRQVASLMNRQVAVTLDEDFVIIFLEAKKIDDHAIHYFIDAINDELSKFVPDATFSWGIGQHKDGIKRFHESYAKAFSALDMVLSQKEAGDRLHFEETRLNQLLLQFVNNDEIKKITQSAIAPLIEYEEQRGIDLIHTFIVYDQMKRNVSKAARKLNLHRQSLLYRLNKIEKLTNLSVDKPDDAFLLNVSIKVWQTSVMTNED